MKDFFISYTQADRTWAEWIGWQLEAGGYSVVLQAWDFLPGENFVLAMHNAAESSLTTIAVLSPDYLESDFGAAEWSTAFRQDPTGAKGRLLPVRVRDVDVPGILGPLNYIDLSNLEKDAAATELITRIERQRGKPETEPAWPGLGGATNAPDICPFPGLEAFGTDTADLFFGRSVEAAECVQRLGRTRGGYRRWLHIDGPSGSGKSSLASAGIVPLVHSRWIRGGPEAWLVAVFRPGREPLLELATSVARALSGQTRVSTAEMWHALQATGDGPSTALATELRDRLPDGHGLLLVVDQLEELFTLGDTADRIRILDAVLTGALNDRGVAFHLVTTMRSDFTARFEELPLLSRCLNGDTSRYFLQPMGPEALGAVVDGMVRRAALRWEPGLSDRMVTAAAAEEGGLPLLGAALQALWEKREAGGLLTHSAYEALGGVGGALASRAEEVLEDLPEEDVTRARRMLLALVQIGRGVPDARRPASRARVLESGGGDERVETLLARLSGGRNPESLQAREGLARLVAVTSGDGQAEADRVDLTHEALLRHWERFREWIRVARNTLERRDDVEAASEAWVRAGSPRSEGLPDGPMLAWYEGGGLDEGELEDYGAQLGDSSRDFLEAAQRLSARRSAAETRRRKRILSGLTAAFIAAVGVAATLYVFQQRAKNFQEQSEDRLQQAVNVANRVQFTINNKLEHVAGAAEVRRELLSVAADLLDTLGGEEDDALRARMAAYGARGDLARSHDNLLVAEREYEASLRIAERLAAADPSDAGSQRDLHTSLNRLGSVYLMRGEFEGALGAHQRALEIAERLGAADPADADLQRDVAVTVQHLGNYYIARGEREEAFDRYQRALEIAERLADADPSNSDWHRNVSMGLIKVGGIHESRGELEEAFHAYQRALEIAERLTAADDSNAQWQRDVFMIRDLLGDVYQARGEFEDALEAYRLALEIINPLAAADSSNVVWQRDIASTLSKLGNTYVQTSELDEASVSFRRSQEIYERLATSDPTNAFLQTEVSQALGHFGRIWMTVGELDEALHAYQQLAEIAKRTASMRPDDAVWQLNVSVSLSNVGTIWTYKGDVKRAREALEESLNIIEELSLRMPSNDRVRNDAELIRSKLAALEE